MLDRFYEVLHNSDVLDAIVYQYKQDTLYSDMSCDEILDSVQTSLDELFLCSNKIVTLEDNLCKFSSNKFIGFSYKDYVYKARDHVSFKYLFDLVLRYFYTTGVLSLGNMINISLLSSNIRVLTKEEYKNMDDNYKNSIVQFFSCKRYLFFYRDTSFDTKEMVIVLKEILGSIDNIDLKDIKFFYL